MTIDSDAAHEPAAMPATPSVFAPGALPPQVDALLVFVAQRRLLLPLLLLVAAHRPLGFVTGQLLFAAQPLTLLFPSLGLRVWAETLSDWNGLRQVEARLSALSKKDRYAQP